jgi:transposase
MAKRLPASMRTRQSLSDVIEASIILTYFSRMHRRVLRLAQTDETCRRLMTRAGGGAVNAAAFMATVDDPQRFRCLSSVGAYFGLTSRRCHDATMSLATRAGVGQPTRRQPTPCSSRTARPTARSN